MLALVSCGGGGGGGAGNPCSDLNLKVTGGTQCKFERSPVVAILSLNSDGSVGLCTGTMVTVNDVLTAAHCFKPNLIDVTVFVDQTAFQITNGAIHPGYNGQVGSPFDLAMLTIEGVLDIGPVPLILSDLSLVDEQITVYGYGSDEEGLSGLQEGPSAFKAGRMGIARMSPGLFDADFDETGSAICQGDSGGPATQTINGITGIVGVTSFTVGGCTSGSVSGFVNIQYPEIHGFITGYAPDVAIR